MIEFGKTLKAAREAKSLTVAQLAEQTNLMPSTVTQLEAEDFSRIAAPIYGRGFIKLYCEAVGLDPKPLIDEYMAISNGDRITIKERPIAPEAKAAPDVEPEIDVASAPNVESAPIDEPQPSQPLIAEPDLFAQPEPQPELGPAPSPSVQFEFSRYSAPLHHYTDRIPSGAFKRWLILAVSAAVLLTLLIFGLRALYRATSVPASEMPKPVAIPEEVSVKPVKAKAVPAQPTKASKVTPSTAPKKSTRTPQKVPSLYID